MGVANAIDITPGQRKELLGLLSRHLPGVAVWAFGSRVKWTARPDSDLDLVVFSAPEQKGRVAALKEAIEESSLPFRVDLLVWDEIPASFRENIQKAHMVLADRLEGKSTLAGTSGWRTTTLGEFVSLQRGHDLTDPERGNGSVPVMGSAGQNGFHDTALAKGPGVVIGRSGASFGQVHFTPYDYWPHNTCLYVTDFHGNDERFAYYFLKSINFAGYNSGSAQPSLNRNFIYPIEIAVPPLKDQRAIAHILGTLDDKIELNRRINETMEAMARAIFKSWFVDFDPVRAKASGEPPESICRRLGLTPDVLALFPDSFQDSELGEIPKGWNPVRIDDLLELAYGKALKASDRLVGAVPVFGSGGITGFHNEQLVEGPGIIVGRKGTVGSLYWEDGAFYPIDTVFFVVHKVQLSYCFYILQTLGLETMNTDAAVPGLNRANVYRLCVSLPPNELRTEFDRLRLSLRGLQSANSRQRKILESTRDTLLPKLLRGKLPTTQGSH